MIKVLKITLLVLGSLILQSALIARITIMGSRPDLPLALVISIALLRGPIHGELVGFAVGFLGDLFSGGPLVGVQSLSRLITGYSIGFARRRLYSENVVTQLVAGFVATFIVKLIESVHLSLIFTDSQFLNVRISGLILAAAINSVLVVIVFWLAKRLVKSSV